MARRSPGKIHHFTIAHGGEKAIVAMAISPEAIAALERRLA
jgi:hypothetical protein